MGKSLKDVTAVMADVDLSVGHFETGGPKCRVHGDGNMCEGLTWALQPANGSLLFAGLPDGKCSIAMVSMDAETEVQMTELNFCPFCGAKLGMFSKPKFKKIIPS